MVDGMFSFHIDFKVSNRSSFVIFLTFYKSQFVAQKRETLRVIFYMVSLNTPSFLISYCRSLFELLLSLYS
jgi:hypothetical protein